MLNPHSTNVFPYADIFWANRGCAYRFPVTTRYNYVSRMPKAGETITGKKFSIGFGGKGANQCVCSSRLGAKACMVAKVGNDNFGTGTIQNFKDNNVNVDYVSTTDEAFTGAAPIAVNDEGQNSIIVILGANLLLSVEDVNAVESLISSSKVVVCQLEIQAETTLAALKLAKKHNVKSIFNPAPAQTDLTDEYFTACDILCPNEMEAEILSGVPVTCIEDTEKAMEILLGKGCKIVIITMGKLGAVFATQENKTPVHVPATPVTAVDTTGAGDAFIGTLAYFLSTRPDIELQEAIRRSTVVAGISVQKPGTQTSLPWRKDLPDDLFK